MGNKKRAIKYAFLGAVMMWAIIMFYMLLLNTPNYTFDEDGNQVDDGLYPLLGAGLFWSILINLIAFVIIKLIMKLRKYGASATQLLDVYGKKSSSRLEKVMIVICCTIWTLPLLSEIYYDYKLSHPTEKYPTHSTTEIGDYYYDDGTVSSKIIEGKTPVGIVFSLETSEREKLMGYKNGQIISLTDVYPHKVQWDTEIRDCENYPNYTWSNRLKALDDINGFDYTNFEDNSCLTINWDCMHFKRQEVSGISEWYVPTAGQWSLILKNIGGVTVDRMLKFDSETASNNLKKAGINPIRWYWTITEFDAKNAWSIRLANGEFGTRSNKQNGAYVRPVASF